MEKQIVKKIIGGMAVFIFAMFFLQAILPSQIFAEAPLNYDNPNANGKNPYKFKVTDVLNSQLIMQVVGCTGVVDKISTAVTNFLKGGAKDLLSDKTLAAVRQACAGGKGSAEMGAATIINTLITEALKDIIDCKTVQNTSDNKTLRATIQAAQDAKAAKNREECLNGIAITLAKNQLTSMTRYTMNWVNSGFSGDPMYVRNITNFTNSLERNVLETGVNKLIDPNNAYPYGRYFSQSVVRGYNAKTGIDKFANSLVSDLSNFVHDPNSYPDSDYSQVTTSDITNAKNELSNLLDSYPNASSSVINSVNSVINAISKRTGIAPTDLSSTTSFLQRAIDDNNLPNYMSASDLTNVKNILNKIGASYSDVVSGKTALQKAQEANDRFSNDFSTGGWDAFNALLEEKNNILGFTMDAQDELSLQTSTDVQNAKDEVTTNNGFLSQKKCITWQGYNDKGYPETAKDPSAVLFNSTRDVENTTEQVEDKNVYYKTEPQNGKGKCVEYETVTPGSLIQDKVSTYLNSPERQLELATTINDALNSLFTALISRFQNQGLSSLSSGTYTYSRSDLGIGGGLGSNSTAGIDSSLLGSSSLSSSSSGYSNGSFDLTKDLGNTFIHDYNKIPLKGGWTDGQGKLINGWNASTNTPRLMVDLGPLVDGKYPSNVFYEVTKAGDTKLFNEGFSSWAVGDRAFWNGIEWQNWKCGRLSSQGSCTTQADPIVKRGVVQIQKDYVVVAKQMLSILPGIMPKIGELDYCIPGPNPSWLANSGDAYSKFSDLAYTLGYDYKPASWFMARDSYITKIASPPGDSQFNLYEKIFHFFTTIITDVKKTSIENEFTSPYWNKSWKYYRTMPDSTISAKTNDNTIQNTIPWRSLYELGSFKTPIKADLASGKVTTYSTDLLDVISKDLAKFNEEYAKIINGDKKVGNLNGYGTKSLMQAPYIESEATPELLSNDAYLPMASDGLNITKDILTYNDDIATVTDNYNSAISQANTNVYNLNIIKTKVNAIITVAQARRDKQLLVILNDEIKKKQALCSTQYDQCLIHPSDSLTSDTSTSTPSESCQTQKDNCMKGAVTLTETTYQNKYAKCIGEEYINYIDDSDITKDTGNEATRCFDGIDNDRDGLVDAADPDCKGVVSTSVSCTNGDDDDQDGLTDGADPDCQSGGGGEEVNDNSAATGYCTRDMNRSFSAALDLNGESLLKCKDQISKNNCEEYREYDPNVWTNNITNPDPAVVTEWGCKWIVN